MTAPALRDRLLVDRRLRGAGGAHRYLAEGRERFFDLRSPELRDAAELRLLHFAETATKVGRAFRPANPTIRREDLDDLRNDLVHDYPHVKAERVGKFVREELPVFVARRRSARFPERAPSSAIEAGPPAAHA